MKEIVQFDYGIIDSDTTSYLKQNAQETRGLLKRTTEDIIKIGQNLLDAKARLPHGQFIPWVKAELGISQSTSWRFMQVAQGKEIKPKSFTVNDLMERISAPEEEEISDEWIASQTVAITHRGVLLAQAGIDIGRDLYEVAEKLSVQQLLAWAQSEFGMDAQDVFELAAYGRDYKEASSLPAKTMWKIAGAYACWYFERRKAS